MTRAKKEPDRTTVLQVSEGLPGSLNIGQFLTIFPVLLPFSEVPSCTSAPA